MHVLRTYWQSVDPKRAFILAAWLLLAWTLDGLLSKDIKNAIEFLFLGAFSVPELLYRAKTGKWTPLDHPLSYVTCFGWLAAMLTWDLPSIRREHLPPSHAIDIALVLAAIAVLACCLRGTDTRSPD